MLKKYDTNISLAKKKGFGLPTQDYIHNQVRRYEITCKYLKEKLPVKTIAIKDKNGDGYVNVTSDSEDLFDIVGFGYTTNTSYQIYKLMFNLLCEDYINCGGKSAYLEKCRKKAEFLEKNIILKKSVNNLK
jgi:hypothetical protein